MILILAGVLGKCIKDVCEVEDQAQCLIAISASAWPTSIYVDVTLFFPFTAMPGQLRFCRKNSPQRKYRARWQRQTHLGHCLGGRASGREHEAQE